MYSHGKVKPLPDPISGSLKKFGLTTRLVQWASSFYGELSHEKARKQNIVLPMCVFMRGRERQRIREAKRETE